jgi:hypothetical protein
MRRELFALHLPNPERVQADYAVLATLSRGLSGGDILNVCVNAIYAGSVDSDPAKWVVTRGMLEQEIAKVRKAKVAHSGEKAGPKRKFVIMTFEVESNSPVSSWGFWRRRLIRANISKHGFQALQ